MKRRKIILTAGLLTAALLIVVIVPILVWAQGPAVLGVQPDGGRPGEEFDLTIGGSGFGGANEAWVAIGGLEVWDARIESDTVIRTRVRIPEDAQPGPRDVEVNLSFGQNEEFLAVLVEGFSVSEGEGAPSGPGPRPPDEPGEGGGDLGEPGWIVILGVGALAVAVVTVAVTVTLKLRKSALQKQWQTQAQEQDLPETCQSGTHYVKREKPEVKPGRWKVTGLKVTLYDAASRQRGVARQAPPDLVGRVDKAARNRLLWGDSGRLAEETAGIGRELAALVSAWQSLSEAGQDVYVEPRIEGGEASVKFVLYRCTGQPGRWKKVREWEAKVQAVDHFPGGSRGPAAGERPEAYRVFLEEQLHGYVHNLVQEAGRLL